MNTQVEEELIRAFMSLGIDKEEATRILSSKVEKLGKLIATKDHKAKDVLSLLGELEVAIEYIAAVVKYEEARQ